MRKSRFAPSLESCESRALLTASVSVVGGNAISIVADAASNNVVTATQLGAQIDLNVNGTDYLFKTSDVNAIFFDASQSGVGTMETFTNDTNVFSFSILGSGNDTINTGSNFDVVVTGNGVSTVNSGTGYTWVI